ncbi:MAG: N-acetyl-gamma-glutamyl-phosphate reductase, partial [Deltaproteobacteria bacterium]|nr:N-acetyl-gamma-glutamyl-phosphate reductase [Deltaproteobacteria bacterium]
MKVSIVGASGYGGGELLRLLIDHPHVEVHQATSERNAGKPITKVHPNLRKRTSLDFCTIKELERVDLLFVSLPHTQFMQRFNELSGLAEKIVDLS